MLTSKFVCVVPFAAIPGGAVMETTTNAEFPGSTLTSFKSAWQELHVQLTGGKPYYCHIADGNPGGNSFNVSGGAWNVGVAAHDAMRRSIDLT